MHFLQWQRRICFSPLAIYLYDCSLPSAWQGRGYIFTYVSECIHSANMYRDQRETRVSSLTCSLVWERVRYFSPLCASGWQTPSGDSFVSIPHPAIRTLELQTCTTVPRCTWVLQVQTQVLTLVWQVPYTLSPLPNPQRGFIIANLHHPGKELHQLQPSIHVHSQLQVSTLLRVHLVSSSPSEVASSICDLFKPHCHCLPS